MIKTPDAQDLIARYTKQKFNFEAFKDFIDCYTPVTVLPPKPEVRCAVFKGGGVKVIAYLGVLQAMQSRGLIDKIQHVAGSSGGAIFALLLGLGFDGNQINRLFEKIDLTDFTDKRESMLGSGFASSMMSQVLSILTEGKVYSGGNLRSWVEGLLEHVLGDKNATFYDLHQAKKDKPSLKDVYFVATRLRESQEVVFGLSNFPNVRIADAFCASTALPPIYEPVLVREKDGTIIGHCNDGGVFNNFPIGIFDDNQYCEPHYKLKFVRYQDTATPYATNPCTMGFSLISHLEQLNPRYTPLTQRLKLLTQSSQPKMQAITDVPRVEEPPVWGHWDIIRLALMYKFGRLEPEDSEKKYQTHPESIIQIYAEGVDTTEFDLSEEKCLRLIESGRHAFDLWYDKFRDIGDHYQGEYIERLALSSEQLSAKASDKKGFYLEQTARHIQALFNELARYPNIDHKTLLVHVRIQFLCFKLQKDFKKLRKFGSLDQLCKSAFELAYKNQQILEEKLWLDRAYLNQMIDDDKVANHLEGLLKNAGEDSSLFMHCLRTLLGRSVFFCLEYEAPLMSKIALTQVQLMPMVFELLTEKYEQYWQLGKPFCKPLEKMINEVPGEPVLHCANQNPDMEAVSICLKYGFDPCRINREGKNALHHAIDIGNIEAFFTYIKFLNQKGINPHNLTYGLIQQPLIHYLLQNQTGQFIEACMHYAGGELFSKLVRTAPIDEAGITCFEQMASKNDVRLWAMFVSSYAEFPRAHLFTHEKKHFAQKQAAYATLIDESQQHLFHANFYSPDKLKDIKASLLLAMFERPYEDNIIVKSIEKHWNGFISQLFKLLGEAGYSHQIDILKRRLFRGKTLEEIALACNNPDIARLLAGKEQGEHLETSIACETLPLTIQYANRHHFHQVVKTGSIKQVMSRVYQVAEQDADHLIDLFHHLDFADKTPLHYLLDGKRFDLLQVLVPVLIKYQKLDFVFDFNKLFRGETLLDYAKTVSDEAYHQCLKVQQSITSASSGPLQHLSVELSRLHL